MNYWHDALFKPGTGEIKNHPKRNLIRKAKSGTERTIGTAASLYKRHARWKWRRWRILNGRVSIDFLFKKIRGGLCIIKISHSSVTQSSAHCILALSVWAISCFFHIAMVSWVFQCRASVSSSISLGLLPAEKCAILTDMTQGAVSLYHSICSAELPNLNLLRLGFKA